MGWDGMDLLVRLIISLVSSRTAHYSSSALSRTIDNKGFGQVCVWYVTDVESRSGDGDSDAEVG
jgi:hypothetical protein